MYERFTDRARKVLQLANQEAQRLHHEYLGTEHILLGLLKEGSGIGGWVLKHFGMEMDVLRAEVEKAVEPGLTGTPVVMGRLPMAPRCKQAIEGAVEEAKALNHNYVGTEHLLLGILREPECVAVQMLTSVGVKTEDARSEVLNLIGTIAAEKSEASPKGQVVAIQTLLESINAMQLQLHALHLQAIKLLGAASVVSFGSEKQESVAS